MADRPIIFSGPMVRALVEGRKTQTRRLLTPATSLFNGTGWTALHKRQTWNWAGAWVDPGPSPAGNLGPYLKLPWASGDGIFEGTVHRVYPVWALGDRLWVRENILQTLASRSDPSGEWESYWTNEKFEYCADDPAPVKRHLHPNRYNSPFMQLRPSIHMPRRASRLTLIVEEVRVQRLQDISEPDVWAEGLSINPGPPGYAQEEFAALWNSLHGPEAWDANPFVAALTFRVERANINTL